MRVGQGVSCAIAVSISLMASLLFATAAPATVIVQERSARVINELVLPQIDPSTQTIVKSPTFQAFDTSLGKLNSISLNYTLSRQILFTSNYTSPLSPYGYFISTPGVFQAPVAALVTVKVGGSAIHVAPILDTGNIVTVSADRDGLNGFYEILSYTGLANLPNIFYDGKVIKTGVTTLDFNAVLSLKSLIPFYSDGSGVFNDDSYIFKLSYDYTPLATPPSSSVPEPASWAMMIVGFSLLGGAMRRRATKISIVA